MANERRQKRVLYAEASDLVQASHGAALEKLKCKVAQVTSPQAAFDELSKGQPFDLILVGDLSKPINDDDEEAELSVIRKARLLDPSVPILIFTSHNYLDQAYENGATAHMLKPAGVIDLIEFITPYLLFGAKTNEPKQPRQTDSGEDTHSN